MKRPIYAISIFLDRLAGLLVFALMVLVVSNVIMRLTGKPILGAIEFVGFLMAIAIGLSLAYCQAQGSHIAVSLFLDNLPNKIRAYIEILVNIIVFLFLILVVWRLYIYADALRIKAQVSLTTGISFFPFILVIAFGFLVYCLVVLTGIVDSVRKVVRG